MYNVTLNGFVILANFIYAGPQTTDIALIQPFLDLEPQVVSISTVPWDNIPVVAFFGIIRTTGCTPGVNLVTYTLYLYQVDVQDLISVIDYLNTTIATNKPIQSASIVWIQDSTHGFQLQTYHSSVFPYRDVVAFVYVLQVNELF
jgi:hypothetical protein